MRTSLQAIARENAIQHHSREELKTEGAHYTPDHLAGFVARQLTGLLIGKHKAPLRILDPATGDGALLVALLGALGAAGYEEVEVYGFELSGTSIASASERIQKLFPKANVRLTRGDFLAYVLEYHGCQTPTLFDAPSEATRFDVVIANPPYVRTQVMGASESQRLAEHFGLTGRVDLYHAFLMGIARVLEPGGVAGVIVSNRFMTTRSGMSIRGDLLRQFNPLHVWDLGDTKLFSAAVLPAVLLLERKNGQSMTSEPARFTSIYSSKLEGNALAVPNAIEALEHKGLVHTLDGGRFSVEHGLLDHGSSEDDVWRISTETGDAWLQSVQANTWSVFGDVGKVRVGVKTTADKVFIRKDWHRLDSGELPELLRSLTTHHIARRFKADTQSNTRGIVYPHVSIDGRRSAAKLEDYPKTKRYLESHREALESRTYVIEGGRNWFEVWVPQDPDAWRHPKLVFRDITEQPTFWLDLEGTIINGDCYWMICNDHADDELLWLALAVGNSTFIEAFYDRRFNNKLYAGRRRFMTQYVEEFPLPDPEREESQAIIRLTKEIYQLTPSTQADELSRELDRLVWLAFGVTS